jgi:MFS family permease
LGQVRWLVRPRRRSSATAYVFVFAAVIGVSSTLFRPALQALLPSLARTPEELIASNGATSTVESIGTLVGPLVAGVLVSIGSVGIAFAAGAGVLALAAALLMRVTVAGRLKLAAAAATESVRTEIAAGFDVVRRTPKPRLLIGLAVAQAFVRLRLAKTAAIRSFNDRLHDHHLRRA